MLIVSGILLVPFYLKSLDHELYGYWIALLALVSITSALESGVSMVVTRKLTVAFSVDSIEEARQVFSAALMYCYLSGLLIMVYCLFVSLNLGLFMGADSLKYRSTLSIISVLSGSSTILAMLGSIYSSVLASKLDILRPNMYRLIGSLLSLLVTAIVVIKYRRIEGFILGIIAREFVFLTLTKYYSSKVLKPSFNRESIKGIFPLFKELSGQLLGRFSKSYAEKIPVIILALILGGTASLVYDLTFKIFVALRQLIQVIITTVFPILTVQFTRQKRKEKFVDAIDYTLSFVIIMSFGAVYLFFPVLVELWLGENKTSIFSGINLFLVLVISAFTLYFEMQSSNLIAYGYTSKSSKLMIIRGILAFVVFYGFVSLSLLSSLGQVLTLSAVTYIIPLILVNGNALASSGAKILFLGMSLCIFFVLNELYKLYGWPLFMLANLIFGASLFYAIKPHFWFVMSLRKSS